MRVFFVDDSGNRGANAAQPYFCLGGFSVAGEHLKQVGRRLAALKRKWRLDPMPDDEVKFNHIGRDHDTIKKPNPLVRLGYERNERIAWGHEVLGSLAAIPSVRVFAVGVDRRQVTDPKEALRD